MNRRTRVAVAGAATVVSVIGGSWVIAAAGEGPTAPLVVPDVDAADLLSQEAVAADWCELAQQVFGPGGLELAPSIRSTVEAMIAGDATPAVDGDAESAPDPHAAAAAAYLALAESVPDSLMPRWMVVREAGRQAVEGETISDPDGAREAADALDTYLTRQCRTVG